MDHTDPLDSERIRALVIAEKLLSILPKKSTLKVVRDNRAPDPESSESEDEEVNFAKVAIRSNPYQRPGQNVRRPTPSYIYFQSNTRRLMKQEPEHSAKSFGQLSQELSERWKSMSAEERAPWEEMAHKDHQRFTMEKMARAPKPPMNAWILFTMEKRRELQDEMPGLSPCELQKILSTRWRGMTAQQKTVYQTAADQERARYNQEKREWLKKNEAISSHHHDESEPSAHSQPQSSADAAV